MKFITFTLISLSIERVAGTTAGGAEASVTANSIVTPLRVQAIVIAEQAFVNVW